MAEEHTAKAGTTARHLPPTVSTAENPRYSAEVTGNMACIAFFTTTGTAGTKGKQVPRGDGCRGRKLTVLAGAYLVLPVVYTTERPNHMFFVETLTSSIWPFCAAPRADQWHFLSRQTCCVSRDVGYITVSSTRKCPLRW